MNWQPNEVRKVRLTFKNPKMDRHPTVVLDVYEDQRERFSTVLVEYLTFVEQQDGIVTADTVLDAETNDICSLQIETLSHNQEILIQEFMNRTAEFRVQRAPT